MRFLICILFISQLSACAYIQHDGDYLGPVERPISIEDYYSVGSSYSSFEIEEIEKTKYYSLQRVKIQTEYGEIVVDYHERFQKSDDLIFVMPVLGGRNIFANYIADYMAKGGFDSVVVHRDKEFKNPDHFERIEEVFRNNVIRDRIAMDFFENEFGKRDFASFGISRGAINAAITAGVDKRLRYNVLAIGGADLVNLFKDSKERGINRYRKRVMNRTGISEQQFFAFLEDNIKTDPKFLAQYIDARDTLMFLSVFDSSVPIKYGLKLRRRIGQPDTVFIMRGHYTTLLYTSFVRSVIPSEPYLAFPPDYIETEALHFYGNAFKRRRVDFGYALYNIFQLPIRIISKVSNAFW
jgi:hypothetical protein